MNTRLLLSTKFCSMLKIIPSFKVSIIFTSKLQFNPISLLYNIASNIFKFKCHLFQIQPLTVAKNIWTGDCKLGLPIITHYAHLRLRVTNTGIWGEKLFFVFFPFFNDDFAIVGLETYFYRH